MCTMVTAPPASTPATTNTASTNSLREAPSTFAFFVCESIQYGHSVTWAIATAIISFSFLVRDPSLNTSRVKFRKCL